VLIIRIAGQVGPHPNERLEIDPLATQARAASVATAEGPLRGEDRLGLVKAMNSGQTERDVSE
jgi:hypothetical protein